MEFKSENIDEEENKYKELIVKNESNKNCSKYDEKPEKFPWLMYFSGFTANFLLLSSGMSLVWMSPVLPKIMSNNTDINPLGMPITVTELSTMAIFPSIGSPIGLIVSAKMSDAFGRKQTLRIVSLLFMFYHLLTAFGSHIHFYYCGGIIAGFVVSASLVTVSVYNNEVADDLNRGKMGCLMGLSIPSGILLSYLVGPGTSVRTFTLSCTVPALAHLLLSVFIPETPIFLALKGRSHQSMKILERLRRTKNPKIIEAEYNKIETFAENTTKKEKRSFLDIFRNRSPRRAFCMCMGINTVQQLSGIFVLLAFMATIFEEAGSISGDMFAVISGIFQLLVFASATFLVDRFGRRPLLLMSSITCSISLFVLGLYFCLKHLKSPFLDHLNWLPVLVLLIYITGYGLGLGPIPIALVAELFPNDLRAIGTATILFADNACIFLTMFSFPLVAAYLGVHYCMWFFSASCFVGFVFMYFNLIETKGKSFQEIQDILSR